MADERKTLMLPLYEANAYEAALNDVLMVLFYDFPADPDTRATLLRLRNRISDARIGRWGR